MLDAIPDRGLDRPQPVVARASDTAPAPRDSRSGPRWYVLATHTNRERRAHAALHLKGYQVYLPLVTTRRPNRHYRIEALFPGYLFCRLDISRPWQAVRYAPSVFSLLSIDGNPTPCPDGAVEALRAGEAVRAATPPDEALYAAGEAVSVRTGPLADHRGVVVRVTPTHATVALLLMGRLVEASVRLDALTRPAA